MASRAGQSASRLSRNEPQPAPETALAASPPTKRDLASWWKTFKKASKKEEEKGIYIPAGKSRRSHFVEDISAVLRMQAYYTPPEYTGYMAVPVSGVSYHTLLALGGADISSSTPSAESPIVPLTRKSVTSSNVRHGRATNHNPSVESFTRRHATEMSRHDTAQTAHSAGGQRIKDRLRKAFTPSHIIHSFSHSEKDAHYHYPSIYANLNESAPPRGIFGVPLQVSIRYANVAISLLDPQGKSFIYGYVPIVVAKCGVFLKERAQNVEGIFRLAGAERRIKELEEKFDSPDRYGKGLDWDGYTVHDAANILRRYFNKLPEPIIPLEFYDRFREPLRGHEAEAIGQFMDVPMEVPAVRSFNVEAAIRAYQKLITELPPLNRQLLLYILDLLAVFASKSDVNKMTSANLASIFQPGLLSHPQHDMAPNEYKLSQYVLIFLIEHQDSFLIGMQGTAADAQTVKDVESGAPSPRPKTPTTPATPGRTRTSGLDRSASTASAGAESVKKYGSLRRNVSVSSRKSKQSTQSPSPLTPNSYGTPNASGPTGSSVHRSNTLPSKKSPAVPGARFRGDKQSPPPTPSAAGLAPTAPSGEGTTPTGLPSRNAAPLAYPPKPNTTGERNLSVAPSTTSSAGLSGERSPRSPGFPNGVTSQEALLPKNDSQPSTLTPTRERNLSNMFASKSPADGSRQPRKLQKRRIPDSRNESAHSSSNSLGNNGTGDLTSPSHPPNSPGTAPPQFDGASGASPAAYQYFGAEGYGQSTPIHVQNPPVKLADYHQSSDTTVKREQGSQTEPRSAVEHGRRSEAQIMKATASPSGSMSQSSVTDVSEHENIDDLSTLSPRKKEKKSRWRFSNHKHDREHAPQFDGFTNADFATHAGAQQSSSSMASSFGGRPRKSFTNDSDRPLNAQKGADVTGQSGANFEREQDRGREREDKAQKGPIDWFRSKWQERKDREAEKERAKSPQPPSSTRASSSVAAALGSERNASRQSINVAVEGAPARRRGASGGSSGREEGPFRQAPAQAVGGQVETYQSGPPARPPNQLTTHGAVGNQTNAHKPSIGLRPSQPRAPSPQPPPTAYQTQQAPQPANVPPLSSTQPVSQAPAMLDRGVQGAEVSQPRGQPTPRNSVIGDEALVTLVGGAAPGEVPAHVTAPGEVPAHVTPAPSIDGRDPYQL